MLRIKCKADPTYKAIQWNGNNGKEIVDACGHNAKLDTSPYSDTQLTMKGGDCYIVIDLGDWICINEADGEVGVITDEALKEHYEIID